MRLSAAHWSDNSTAEIVEFSWKQLTPKNGFEAKHCSWGFATAMVITFTLPLKPSDSTDTTQILISWMYRGIAVTVLSNSGIATRRNGGSSKVMSDRIVTAYCIYKHHRQRFARVSRAMPPLQLWQYLTVTDVIATHHCRQNLPQCFIHSPSLYTFTPVESTTTCTPLALCTGVNNSNFPNRHEARSVI